MIRNNIDFLFYILCVIELSSSQYLITNKKLNKSNPCEDSNNALVEQFFNIIFTEFHNTPPVCVCVQMCLERPTYCYPNGCLRPVVVRKLEETTTTTAYPINRIQYSGRSPTKSVMFLVDSEKTLLDDMFEVPGSYLERKDNLNSNELMSSSNPFKELVFKYRKLPKLEMRYNLRQKMRDSKYDSIKKEKLDVSKTRWPMNKHFLHGKQLLNRISHYKKNDETQGAILISMFPEMEANVPIFKKSLAKREDFSDANVDSLYSYKTDNGNFSIEVLIDNLIVSSLSDSKNDKKNNTKVKNESVDVAVSEIDQNNAISIHNEVITPHKANNEKIKIILLNFTNADIDTNKYFPDSNSKNTNTYLDLIANMSKEIERNNNASLDFITRISEREEVLNFIKNISLETPENSFCLNNTDLTVDCNTSEMSPNNFSSSENLNVTGTESVTVKENLTITTKRLRIPILKSPNKNKLKQRILRKLNGKLN